MSAQTTEDQLQTALQRIHDLEKEVQRCKSKEEMVNEYAGSMHDKLTEKDALVGLKEARIEYLEGRCRSCRYCTLWHSYYLFHLPTTYASALSVS